MEHLIFKTPHWNISLATDDQTYFGRVAVVLKRPCRTMSEVADEEMLDLLAIIKKYEAVFKKEYGATMFNYTCLMNAAYKNTPPDPQVHWHFRPRYEKPVVFQGVEFADPNFAHHYQRAPKLRLSEVLEQDIVADLRIKFQS